MENDLQTSSRWMILQEENMNSSIREILKDKKRIVIKIGSSSLTHPETGALNLTKLEVLVREISDLHNMGKDVIVVSSGAIAVGRRAAGLGHRPRSPPMIPRIVFPGVSNFSAPELPVS